MSAVPVPKPGGVVDLAAYRGRGAVLPLVVAAPPAEVPPVAPSATEHRVLRRVRLRSVAKMAAGMATCAYAVVVGALVLLWLTASALGVVANLESLAEDLGWQDVTFDGPGMLRAVLIGGGILVVASTLLSVVFAEVFNLLSRITGGLEAEVASATRRRRPRRRRA